MLFIIIEIIFRKIVKKIFVNFTSFWKVELSGRKFLKVILIEKKITNGLLSLPTQCLRIRRWNHHRKLVEVEGASFLCGDDLGGTDNILYILL